MTLHEAGLSADAVRRLSAAPAPSQSASWQNRLLVTLLRREAESRILLDPRFPANPFAEPSAGAPVR